MSAPVSQHPNLPSWHPCVPCLYLCLCFCFASNITYTIFFPGLPRWLSGKEVACQCRRQRLNPWVGNIPWRRTWQPTPVSLSGKFHWQRSLIGVTIHRVTQSIGSQGVRHDWARTHIHTGFSRLYIYTHTHTHKHFFFFLTSLCMVVSRSIYSYFVNGKCVAS